ncbi:MAG: M48 family metallopeptidase [Hyphomicrobium sp.]
MPSSPATPAAKYARYYVRFSDGRSASARDGEATLALGGVEITLQNPFQRHLWPYASLKAGEPLRPSAVDVLLSSSTAPGATAFVPSPDFAAALAEHAPHLTVRAERWRHARPWLAIVGALAGLIALIYAAGWTPMRTIASMLPEPWRDRLGEQAIASMTEGHKKCVDRDGLAALKSLVERLTRSSDAAKTFDVVVYDWPLMNAFAVPGDQIVMTKGLIDKADGPDEVAGVLAHEMGHGIEMHPETGIIRAIGLAAAVELMMGGSSGALANIGLALAQIGYTRVAEHEADVQGLRLLKEAGISPQGLGDFFKRVQKIERDGELSSAINKFDILRTHPPTEERAQLVRRQPTYPATPALDAKSWQDLKSICRVTEAPETTPKPAPDDQREL